MQDTNSLQNIFREYDIRGIFGHDLTQNVVFNIGLELSRVLKNEGENGVHIGIDARTHSKTLFAWLKEGFAYGGIKVYDLGLIPTPVAYFATYNELKLIKYESKIKKSSEAIESSSETKNTNILCRNSVMITGSHNPPEYNGFKITIKNIPFYGEQIKTLGERLMAHNTPFIESSTLAPRVNALDSYIKYLSQQFAHLKNFPYKIGVDCGNGVAGVAFKPILESLGIEYSGLFFNPDGNFPHHHPDPSEEKNLLDLKNLLKQQNLEIGIAFDGDADRLALLSQNHNFYGDEMAILFANEMASRGIKPKVIGEVKCSQIMYDEINKIGQAYMYKTGHSNIKVKLKELNAHIGAEMSGHIFFKERYFGYDDAIYSALRALELFLQKSPQEIQDFIENLPRMYSTKEEKIATTEEKKFSLIESLKTKLANPPKDFPPIKDIIDIDGVRVRFENGWGLLRASNTTPVIVTRFEANSKENLEMYKKAMIDLAMKN